MALKIKFVKPAGRRSLRPLLVLTALMVTGLCALAGGSVFAYYYFKYQRIVDARFRHPVFVDTAQIYAAPREVRPGQKLPISLIANELREAGYTAAGATPVSQLGTFSLGPQSITVYPARNPFMRRTARPFTSAMEWWTRSPTAKASSWPVTRWSRC